MTNEELEKYKNRIIELKQLPIKAKINKDYRLLSLYMKEIIKISKILKRAEKNARKRENKEILSWFKNYYRKI